MASARIFALALLAAVPVLALGSEASAATPEASTAATRVAISARVTHGGTIAIAKSTSAYGEATKLSVRADDHQHDIRVTVRAVEGGDEYTVELGYSRDGKRVFKAKKIEVRGNSVEVDAGKGTTIALELKPAKAKRRRIELPEGNDPLAGV